MEFITRHGSMSVNEAGEYLLFHNSLNEPIIRPTKTGNKTITPIELLDVFPGDYPAAGAGPILFCGGPPGHVRWLAGSLLTMILDKMLYNVTQIERRVGC